MTQNKNIINANAMALTPQLPLALLERTNLHWEMHRAQVFALEVCDFSTGSLTTANKEASKEFLKVQYTMGGLPITVREDYPKSLLRLMQGDTELGRIEALAIPSAFGGSYNPEEAESERHKFNKIIYGDATLV